MLFLKVKYTDGLVKRHKFYQRKHIKIGRWRNNHIILDDPTVSGHHARIDTVDNGLVVLNDLDSSNGTYVNGDKVTSHALKNDDVIVIGKCTIMYNYDDVDQKLDDFEAQSQPKTVVIDRDSHGQSR